MLQMKQVDLKNKRVMIREDLNVPIRAGVITNAERITRALPTIQAALSAGAAVILVSHLGRPTPGQCDPEFSLAPVAEALTEALGQEVVLVRDWLDQVSVQPGAVVLCENVRFLVGEKENDPALSQRMATLCDVFVMDAFATAHRCEASTVGVIEYAKVACAGPLLCDELAALHRALDKPKRPLVAIVGGAKVSTKMQLLDRLIDQVDVLITGGGIANTLLVAQGHSVGVSLYEPDWVSASQVLLEKAKSRGVALPLPLDVAVAQQFDASEPRVIKSLDAVSDTDMILDVGPETIAAYAAEIAAAKTVIWNGPLGVFEFPSFSEGTRALGDAIVSSDAYSVAGGGDTVAALSTFGFRDRITYVSTGGGAFLEWLEGGTLPAVAILEEKA